MAKFGCPPRFIALLRQFHDGMQGRVQNDEEFSEQNQVTGVVSTAQHNVFWLVILVSQSGTTLMAKYST